MSFLAAGGVPAGIVDRDRPRGMEKDSRPLCVSYKGGASEQDGSPYLDLGVAPKIQGEVGRGRGLYRGVAERERSCLASGNAEDPDSRKVILDKSRRVDVLHLRAILRSRLLDTILSRLMENKLGRH